MERSEEINLVCSTRACIASTMGGCSGIAAKTTRKRLANWGTEVTWVMALSGQSFRGPEYNIHAKQYAENWCSLDSLFERRGLKTLDYVFRQNEAGLQGAKKERVGSWTTSHILSSCGVILFQAQITLYKTKACHSN